MTSVYATEIICPNIVYKIATVAETLIAVGLLIPKITFKLEPRAAKIDADQNKSAIK